MIEIAFGVALGLFLFQAAPLVIGLILGAIWAAAKVAWLPVKMVCNAVLVSLTWIHSMASRANESGAADRAGTLLARFLWSFCAFSVVLVVVCVALN